ncbi:hypothetical protein C882_3338 [Caenispirillum salinarum AK4]|uniref:Polysaccharide biosynthesis protein C-terminal domain-containing protein n=1 Tax=Caenispirillum salinarum AK4 TaxID=1238182 RepID=K9HBB3_9PROT|nr:lipopolysaccharide biosynthesis protein [Caenispirillum salinarum]EKV26051.1 hypothetical protein C882_3338 [Caenispirillum salinarum AK4]
MSFLVKRSAWYMLASLAGAGISVAVLPFATQVIGAAEYGALAIAMAVATLATAMGAAAIGFVLSEHYLRVEDALRGEISAAAVIAAYVGAVVAALILLPAAILLLPQVMEIDEALRTGIMICLLGAVVGAPWVVASEVFMLEGRAAAFAIGTIGQALTNAAVVLVLLFVWPMPDLALFIGNAAGHGVLFLVGIGALWKTLRCPKGRRWFDAMRSKAVSVGRASLAESGRSLFERSYLGSWTTVAAVGLFSHAQLYRNWAMLALNAVSRAVWPVNLAEANEPEPTFRLTRASWNVVQAGLAGMAIVFALFGREIISLLTSGKFVEATPFAIILLCSLLIQTAGKPYMVLLIARGEGQHTGNAAAIGTVCGLAALAGLVPWLGAMGAALAAVLQMVVTRSLIVRAGRRIHRLAFADWWVVVGLVLAAGTYVWTDTASPGILPRVLVLAFLVAVMAFAVRRSLMVFLKYRGLPDTGESASQPNGQSA